MTHRGLLALGALVVLVVPVATADMYYDQFWCYEDATGAFTGGSTGYPGMYPDVNGEWYYYPQTDWWNTWFYNGPFRPPPWYKIIHVEADVTLFPGGTLDLAFNWATDEWSLQDPPPSGPWPRPPLPDDVAGTLEGRYIGRYEFWSGQEPITQHIVYDYIIPDYNPEWVSIDVRGDNYEIVGEIWHECVPEPASAMLALCGLLLLRRR